MLASLLVLFWIVCVADSTSYNFNSEAKKQDSVIHCTNYEVCKLRATGEYTLSGSTIHCNPYYDCHISCIGKSSCFNSTINCPVDHLCDITALNSFALQGSTIHAQEESNCLIDCYAPSACEDLKILNGHCHFNCRSEYACYNAKNITCNDWIIPVNSPEEFPIIRYECSTQCDEEYTCSKAQITCLSTVGCSIHCNGPYGCASSIINCPIGKCTINCYGYYGCYESVINCLSNNCTIKCGGDYSCYKAIINGPSSKTKSKITVMSSGHYNSLETSVINGTNADLLEIIVHGGKNSLKNATIYCPNDIDNSNSEPKCIIDVTTGYGNYNNLLNGTKFYAVRGFGDLRLTCPGIGCNGDGTKHSPKLFCKLDFYASCVLRLNDDIWSCVSPTDCNS